jgi:hypothetical protein
MSDDMDQAAAIVRAINEDMRAAQRDLSREIWRKLIHGDAPLTDCPDDDLWFQGEHA